MKHVDLCRRNFATTVTAASLFASWANPMIGFAGEEPQRSVEDRDPIESKQDVMPAVLDTIVVGGNFAGVAAALHLARGVASVALIDSGLPRNRFAQKANGLFGHDGVSVNDLRKQALLQVDAYPNAHLANARVATAEKQGDVFSLTLDDGRRLTCRRIVLAHGVSDILPDVVGLKSRWGQSVNQCPYCHGYESRDKRWVVLSTGDASVHQALIMTSWTNSLAFLTNGHELSTDQQAQLTSSNIKVVDATAAAIHGRGSSCESVSLAGTERRVPADAVFTITKTQLSCDLARQLGCKIKSGPFGPYIETDGRQQTSVEGVFAAGDAAREIHASSWAIADGATAGIFAHQSLAVSDNPYSARKQP